MRFWGGKGRSTMGFPGKRKGRGTSSAEKEAWKKGGEVNPTCGEKRHRFRDVRKT